MSTAFTRITNPETGERVKVTIIRTAFAESREEYRADYERMTFRKVIAIVENGSTYEQHTLSHLAAPAGYVAMADAMGYCECGRDEGNYPCEYGTAGEGCGY